MTGVARRPSLIFNDVKGQTLGTDPPTGTSLGSPTCVYFLFVSKQY